MTGALGDSTTMREFVEQARQAAGMSSYEEANALVRATLRTLAEAVTGGQIDELAPGLPDDLRAELSGRSGQARSMDENGFLDRVSGSVQTTDLDQVKQQVRAVLRTVRAWAPQGEARDTARQLPKSLAALFDD